MSRRFDLNRIEDPTGVSGTGIVAEGVLFDSGKAVVSWLNTKSIVVWDSIEDAIKIHGHDGLTRIEFID